MLVSIIAEEQKHNVRKVGHFYGPLFTNKYVLLIDHGLLDTYRYRDLRGRSYLREKFVSLEGPKRADFLRPHY